jgi:hypothetical protein
MNTSSFLYTEDAESEEWEEEFNQVNAVRSKGTDSSRRRLQLL